jgi:hypothetical protein
MPDDGHPCTASIARLVRAPGRLGLPGGAEARRGALGFDERVPNRLTDNLRMSREAP